MLHLHIPFSVYYSGGHVKLKDFTKNLVKPQDSSSGV